MITTETQEEHRDIVRRITEWAILDHRDDPSPENEAHVENMLVLVRGAWLIRRN
jgi:hypothetical protein